jgi:hypothetical protein
MTATPEKPTTRVATRDRASVTHYSTMVLGDGSILPIVESLGKRQLREIDPLSVEGRQLLANGRVRLCYEDGRCVEAVPIQDVLERLDSVTRLQRGAYPSHVKGWTRHHDRMLRHIGRMKRKLRPQN